MIEKYSITIAELLQRPIIRDEHSEEWMNKMTDNELDQWDIEAYALCIKDGISERYPNLNAAWVGKHIDRTILYNLFKLK